MHLWQEEPVQNGDSTTYGVTLEVPGSASKRLWYSTPSQFASMVTDSCDPLLIGTIYMAMEHHADLRVHGRVSPSLLRNLVPFQNAWRTWQPDKYNLVEITADHEKEDEPGSPTGLAICGFSGGADSTYSIFRHRLHPAIRHERRNLTAALLVHGFDIPLKQEEPFNRFAEQSRLLLERIGVSLLTLKTNFREHHSDWVLTYGVALASSLMLFKGSFTEGMIATDESNLDYFPMGSNPITDPLLSSDSFKIVDDALACLRAKKITELEQWPDGYHNLRVCFSATEKDRNCGRCPKCTTTWLYAQCLNSATPRSLPAPSPESILAMNNVSQFYIDRINKLSLSPSWNAKITEPMRNAIKRCLVFNQRQRMLEKPLGNPQLNFARKAVALAHKQLGVFAVFD